MKPVVTVCKAAVLVLLFALVAAGSGWAQSDQQQSLGDVARKQKEKKGQAEPKGTKVLTNEDLPTSGGLATSGSSSGTATSSASAAGEAAGDAAAAPEGEKQAAAPGEDSGMTAAEEADAAKKKLEGLKHDEQSYKNGLSHFEELLSNEVNESRRELYRNAMQHGQERLADNLKQQTETEKEVAAKEAAAKQQQNQPQASQPPPAQPPAEQPPQ